MLRSKICRYKCEMSEVRNCTIWSWQREEYMYIDLWQLAMQHSLVSSQNRIPKFLPCFMVMSCLLRMMCSLLMSASLSLKLTHHKLPPVKLWTGKWTWGENTDHYLGSLWHCDMLPSWSVVTTPVTCSDLWCWKPLMGISGALSLNVY